MSMLFHPEEAWEDYAYGIRQSLAPRHRNMPDEDLAEMIEELTSEMTAEEVEFLKSLFRGIKRGVRHLSPLFSTAGTLAGTALGGSSGAVIGNQVGSALSSLFGKPRRRRRRSSLQVRQRTAPPAATQLLSLLNHPALQGALGSLLMGTAGKKTVSLGPKQASPAVPVNAMMQLLSKLARSAESEWLAQHPELASKGFQEEIGSTELLELLDESWEFIYP